MRLETDHPLHSKLFPNYWEMRWINLNDEVIHVGNDFQASVDRSGEYYIELDFTFFDGAHNDNREVSCSKRFGLFDLSFLSDVDNLELSANISILPNPNNGVFDIVVGDFDQDLDLTIFALDGKIVKSLPIGGSKTTVNLSQFGSGTYLYKISDSTGKQSFGKVVVID